MRTVGTVDSAGRLRAPATFFVPFAALLVLLSSPQALATPMFVGIGPVGAIPSDLSANGSTVVGIYNRQAFRWTEGAGLVQLGDLPGGGVYSEPLAVSADGSVVVGLGTVSAGRGAKTQAFRWTEAEGMVLLGELGPGGSEASAVSADGTVIAGWTHSADAHGRGAYFRWTAETGMVALDPPSEVGDISSLFYPSISGDGGTIVASYSVTVGASKSWWAAGWTAGEAGTLLRDASGVPFRAMALGLASDGGVVTGDWPASRWTTETGRQTLVAGIAGATDTSRDGSVVVGWDFNTDDLQAFIWDAANGTRMLRDVLVSLGLDLSGWELFDAVAVSDDGVTIMGGGTQNGQYRTWLARLPDVIQTPEPSSALLLGLGLGALAWLRRARPSAPGAW